MTKLTGKAKIKFNKKIKNKSEYYNAVRKKTILSKIKKYDAPILKESCSPVSFKDEEIKKIAKEMIEVLSTSKNGVGIAASQIGYDKRIIAVCLDKKKPENITIFLNPSITYRSDEKIYYKEGCLSYPNFYSTIERPQEIEVMYETIDGEEKIEKFKDFSCVVLCHEIDHTKGVCLVGDSYYREKEEEIKRRKNRRRKRN